MEEYERDKHGKYSIKTRRKKAVNKQEQRMLKRKKKYSLSEAKQKLKSMGRRGDTELEHVTKEEQRMLRRMGASRSKNPKTGLTENFSLQKWYDKNVKKNLPKGLDTVTVGQNMLGSLNAAEEFTGKMITDVSRAPVKIVYGLAGAGDPYDDQGSSQTSSTSSSNVSTRTGGFGSVKRKKKKKRGVAESDTEGKDMSGGKMSKRGLRTPKRTGLNIVKKNSSSTSLGM